MVSEKAGKDAIQQKLEENEKLLWSGRPNPNVFFTSADLFLVPFSLMWTGFAVYMAIDALTKGAAGFYVIMPLIFCIVGLYVTLGRFIVKRVNKKKTFYALTNKKAIEIVLSQSKKSKMVRYSRIKGVSSTISKNGRGSLTFSRVTFLQGIYANTGMDFSMSQQNSYPAFYDVDQAEIPLGIIKEKLNEANQ